MGAGGVISRTTTTDDGVVWELPVTAETAMEGGRAAFACSSYSFATGMERTVHKCLQATLCVRRACRMGRRPSLCDAGARPCVGLAYVRFAHA